MDNKELKHYGVPGMKWGVRKNRIPSADSVKTSKIRKKKVNEMTNEELQTANRRLELESKYKQLTKKPNHVKNAITTFTKTAGTIAAATAAAAAYKKIGNQIIDKIGDLVIKDIKPIHFG